MACGKLRPIPMLNLKINRIEGDATNAANGIILLVDDDPRDVEFVRHFCQKLGVTNVIHLVSDGKKAIDYLAGHGRY